MPAIRIKKHYSKKSSKEIITDKVKGYGNDPFVIKKTNESKQFLEQHGFPNELSSLQKIN